MRIHELAPFLAIALVAAVTSALVSRAADDATASASDKTQAPAVRGAALPHPPVVLPGIDVLEQSGFAAVRGKRVGLVTNPTGLTADLRSTVDVLHRAEGVTLVALYGPEHGVRGEAAAGVKVADGRDGATGLPEFSLYGATRKPTAEMLSGVDVLVFDIQDIGSRSYTYISTLAVVMEAAAEHGKAVVVLDRPNPINGERVEGRVLDPKFRSFVGQLEIPYLHGMTVGELAQMINGEGWLGRMGGTASGPATYDAEGGGEGGPGGLRCELTVIPMRGWTRKMDWAATGLVWTPTSPHLPRAETSLYYAATGICGELGTISIGIGYPLPFELFAAPGVDARKLADEMNGRGLAGVYFRPMHFTPFYGAHEKRVCSGVHIVFTDPARVEAGAVQFHLLDALRVTHPEIPRMNPKRAAMFDKVCGGEGMRTRIEAGSGADELLAHWREGVDQFRAKREKYLLYR